MNNPLVSILVTDVGLPALGHVIELARLLEPHCGVEVVGPDLGKGVNPMYQDAWPLKVIDSPRMYRWPNWLVEARKLEEACSGQIIIADKAFANTLGVALKAKRRSGKKVVLYLDEWDGAFLSEQDAGERWREKLKHLHHPLEGCWFDKWERKARGVDLVISSTTFLQKKFGGQLLDLGTDCKVFHPQEHPELRAELGLEGTPLVVFGGVARAHKGVEDIVDALPDDAHLLIVGPETDHARELMRSPRVHCTGAKQKAEMPKYLSLADVIALPMQPTSLGISQMPVKVFEALAMGKPVIGSAVSDLPRVLEGCGTTVPAGDVSALRQAIAAYLSNPVLASTHRGRARGKALEEYNVPVVSQKLWDMIRPLSLQ